VNPRLLALVEYGLQAIIVLIVLDLLTTPATARRAAGWHALMTTAGHVARTAGRVSMWAELNYRRTVAP
jgi:hypothetical protein